MSRKYKIAHFGAFDVNSFGDSMFPVATRIELEKRISIGEYVLFSPVGTDKSYNKNGKIYSYGDFEKIEEVQHFDLIIIGGGEMLHFKPIQFFNSIGSIIEYKAGEIWKNPIDLAKKYNIPYIVQGVGIPYEFNEDEGNVIYDYLKDALLVGVRDKYSYKKLMLTGNKLENIYLQPDILWLIDEYFAEKELIDIRVKLLSCLKIDNEESYIVVQYGTMYQYDRLADVLKQIELKYHYKFILLPVNNCHEDVMALDSLHKALPDCSYYIETLLQPEEIVAVISGAKFFIGTSLHGNLVATAYGIPSIAIDMYPNIISKLDGFYEWINLPKNLIYDPHCVLLNMERQLKLLPMNQHNRISTIKDKLKSHFELMCKKIVSGEKMEKIANDNDWSLPIKKCYFTYAGLSGDYESICCYGHEKNGSIEFIIGMDEKTPVRELTLSIPLAQATELNVEECICDGEIQVVRYENSVQDGICLERTAIFTINCYSMQNLKLRLRMNSVDAKELNEIYFVNYNNRKLHIEQLINSERAYKREIQQLLLDNNNINQKIKYQEELICDQTEKLAKVKGLLQKQMQHQAERNKENELSEYRCKELEAQLEELIHEFNSIANSLDLLKKQYKETKVQLQNAEQDLQRKSVEIINKDGHINLLLDSDRELDAIKRSRSWRFVSGLRKITSSIAPPKSKRRVFIKIGVRSVRHPLVFMRAINSRKIRNFFYYLKKEGPTFVSERIDDSLKGTKIDQMNIDTVAVAEKPFDEYENFSLPKVSNPMVSIVIPVYNQFSYTYNCLKAILENTGDNITYEVIIANDCSTDDTSKIDKKVENLILINNKENLRFLRNCNNAAKRARGEFILFLNNDTQVQQNWLEPLVSLIKSKDDIGMVGSKLVYADGRLQEAGGIIWKDASAWNYGNASDPTSPEYNYVKEVDYISGAAIMIRSELWKKIGGFHDRFAPAYYEDTDLACEVRKHGYKVMYQPLSVVVHYEGISNGTDTSSGQKAYQVANQKKFYEKWKDTLNQENYNNAENVFLAKDRSKDKKTILFIDHYVPMYDKDAGSRCIFYYVNLFIKMGYNVKFIGDNFFKHEPYTTTLQQLGVEVLYGDYYYNNWKDWIKENGKYFDYVFLSRPHISIKYIDFMMENTNAKLIYFGHDLHFLREMREYELTGVEKALKESIYFKKIELELMRKADISYYLSNVELEEIRKEDPEVKTRRVPINIYDDIPEPNYVADERKEIIFVGGFGHPPNTDAVKWLGEIIMPLVWKSNPDIVLHIVGSKPPQEIQDFASDRMIIHGFVSDEDLEAMYQSVRMAIVPLRYGAGIKGKIIEAMMRGIPIITTSIGVEGIEGAENILKVSDSAEELAKYIIDLYSDDNDLKRIADEEYQYICENYSIKNAVEILGNDFEFRKD